MKIENVFDSDKTFLESFVFVSKNNTFSTRENFSLHFHCTNLKRALLLWDNASHLLNVFAVLVFIEFSLYTYPLLPNKYFWHSFINFLNETIRQGFQPEWRWSYSYFLKNKWRKNIRLKLSETYLRSLSTFHIGCFLVHQNRNFITEIQKLTTDYDSLFKQ